MQLHTHAGDRDRANHRYRALATQLARDDLEPEPETTDLRRQIMRADQRIG
jgi:DNA-binding SARP family transcriptional activator